MNNIETVSEDNIQFTINDQQFFEILLLEIRGKTISYSSFQKKMLAKQEEELHKNRTRK